MRRIGIDVGGTNTDAVVLEEGRVAHAVKTLGVKPGQLHGFFTVIPEQPHAIAFELFPAELICYFEQERTG